MDARRRNVCQKGTITECEEVASLGIGRAKRALDFGDDALWLECEVCRLGQCRDSVAALIGKDDDVVVDLTNKSHTMANLAVTDEDGIGRRQGVVVAREREPYDLGVRRVVSHEGVLKRCCGVGDRRWPKAWDELDDASERYREREVDRA